MSNNNSIAPEILADLSHHLSREIDGEVRLDEASRKLYSTDASIYQIEPLGVVIPRNHDDLQATMALAAQYGIPVLPRGSGSSLAGQTVGAALIIDCSTFLNHIIQINKEESYAIVEPGLVLDTFNRTAAPYGIKYGPDPASSDRASFGGMLGNNSTGAHSILYGMASDNILAMDVVLSDGSIANFSQISMQLAQQRSHSDSLEAKIYAAALSIRSKYAEEIKARWPKSWRRASGYSLNYLLPWSPSQPPLWDETLSLAYPPIEAKSINLAPLMVGSEGTLAVISRAKIRLNPRLKKTVLGILSFESVASACDATPELLKLKPSAVELIPQEMIRLAKSVPAYANQLSFVQGDPEAILVIEFSGTSRSELNEKLKKLGPRAVLARTQEEQERVWKVRKVALGLLMSRKGDSKPLPFIEDVAVPAEALGDFVRGLQRIFAENNTHGEFYAHASAGCLHVRPVINLKTLQGVKQMRAITASVVQLANRFSGAMSGEHGDGLARSEWLEDTFGPEIIQAFRELKLAADPHNILNPGKIVDPPPMQENLRFGPEYKTDAWVSFLDFSSQGGLLGAIEMCNGAGVCRKEHGAMCPSFQASQEEMHSTRGRANLLRNMISGQASSDSMGRAMALEALDLCLECKACKAECPSAVDMAKLKIELLHHHYQQNRRPLRDYFFAYFENVARFAQPFAQIANPVLATKFSRWVAQSLLGISAKRRLPSIASHKPVQPPEIDLPDVLLLSDTYNRFVHPEIEEAAFAVLQAANIKFRVLPILGAGRPLISKAFLPRAREHAKNLIDAIYEMDPDGTIPILGLEPSEIYSLNDEYLDFFPGDEKVLALSRRAYLLEEYLLRSSSGLNALKSRISLSSSSREILLHGHCFQKAQAPASDGVPNGQAATAALISHLGWNVETIPSGCCGMAGSFGYEAEHYDLSMQVGELELFPAVRKASSEQIMIAPGLSCRTQIESGTQRSALHPMSLISAALS